MSIAAWRWTRTLTDSDIPDSAVVWPQSSTAKDDEPRFAEEERPTRISTCFVPGPARRTSERAPLPDLELGEDDT